MVSIKILSTLNTSYNIVILLLLNKNSLRLLWQATEEKRLKVQMTTTKNNLNTLSFNSPEPTISRICQVNNNITANQLVNDYLSQTSTPEYAQITALKLTLSELKTKASLQAINYSLCHIFNYFLIKYVFEHMCVTSLNLILFVNN